MTHRSIANIPESDLIATLLADWYWRQTILNFHGIPNQPEIRQCVSLASLPGQGDGDVDILAWDRKKPESATAVEVKRIKVGAGAFVSGKPNKLQEYEKACRQANRLARIGFWQVYLFVLVVVDSREQNAGRNTYEGATPELERVIVDTITVRGLKPTVGVARHDFIQPMDYPPLGVGAGGIHLLRVATSGVQPDAVTAWVAQLK
jgi:hypothetical protein